MEMPERGYNAETYRYGFNGKENDKETGWQDYGFRLYDKRICRFPSVDPLTAKYPELTPYQFASNTPIMAIDLDGLEAVKVDKSTQQLVIVNLGAGDPRNEVVSEGKTLADNVNQRDSGLGAITDKSFTSGTKVLTYSPSHGNLTVDDIVTTIYRYKEANPSGKVVLVGHSLGAENMERVANKLKSYEIQVDLIVTLDPASKPAQGADNLFMPDNVKNEVNFYNDPKTNHLGINTAGGKVYKSDGNKKTNLVNILSPKTIHTTIDNTLAPIITKLINSFLGGKDPIKEAKSIKMDEVLPVANDGKGTSGC
jgi:RHS repeat-associated protein